MCFTIARDIQICFINASTFKPMVIVGENLPNFLGFGSVFFKIERYLYELGAKFLSYEARHPTPATKFSGMVIARRQNAFAHSKWYILQLWPVELFYCSIKCVTIDVDDCL